MTSLISNSHTGIDDFEDNFGFNTRYNREKQQQQQQQPKQNDGDRSRQSFGSEFVPPLEHPPLPMIQLTPADHKEHFPNEINF